MKSLLIFLTGISMSSPRRSKFKSYILLSQGLLDCYEVIFFISIKVNVLCIVNYLLSALNGRDSLEIKYFGH